MPAIAVANTAANASRNHGTLWYDVRDAGLVSNDSSAAAANRTKLQALVDSLLPSGPGIIYFPTGTWYINRPLIVDANTVELRGEGNMGTSTTSLTVTPHTTPLVFGVARQPLGVALTADHLVDLSTTPLNGSMVSAANQRWGLRTKADCHIAFQATALDAGPIGTFWGGVQALTIDLAIDLTNAPGTGAYPAEASLMGMEDNGVPTPWKLAFAGSTILLSYRLADGTIGPGTAKTASIVLPSAAFHRVTFQVDLLNGAVIAFLDKFQVAVTGTAPTAGSKFTANQHSPFGLGSNSELANQVAQTFGSPADITIGGLSVIAAPVYQNNGVGSAQARIDGTSDTDAKRYLPANANLVAYLPLTDSPTQMITDRMVTVNHGDGSVGTGFFLDNTNHGVFSAVSGNSVSGLRLRAGDHYGQGCTLGITLGFRAEECIFAGGYHGIGSFNMGSTYPVTVRRCMGNTADALVYLFFASTVELDDLYVSTCGRTAFRFVYTSAKIRNLMVAGFGTPEYIVRGTKGYYLVDYAAIDFESAAVPSIAAFYASPGVAAPVDGWLSLQHVLFGTIANNSTFVMLDDGGLAQDDSNVSQASFSMRDWLLYDSTTGGALNAIVQTNGTRWYGEFDATNSRISRGNYVKAIGTGNRVVSRHTNCTGPAREGAWTQNAHILEVKQPVAGQFTEWRCTATGAYGTATAPAWMGLNPLDGGGNGLAAYILDHAYWAAGLAGGVGCWTNYTHNAFLNFYFKGTATSAPSVYAALSWDLASRIGTLSEVSGGSYARVALSSATWNASSTAATANAQAITFPTLTATLTGTYSATMQSLALCDASTSGHALAMTDVTPVVMTSGITPSYAIGAVTSARAATNQGFFADSFLNAFNNFWLRGTALTPPTIYLALSTAPATLGVGPTEPVGGGYARVTTSTASWQVSAATAPFGQRAVVTNAAPLTFPAPTGTWGVARAVYLMDALTSGNVIAAANLVVPRSPVNGDPAPAFATGALWVCRS